MLTIESLSVHGLIFFWHRENHHLTGTIGTASNDFWRRISGVLEGGASGAMAPQALSIGAPKRSEGGAKIWYGILGEGAPKRVCTKKN